LISNEQEVIFPSAGSFTCKLERTDPLIGPAIIEMAER